MNENKPVVEVELASRLTLKDLECDPSEVLKLPEGKTKLAIARMYGICRRVGFQEDDRTNATYVFFVGDFEGINLQTGFTLQSSKLYLPEGSSQSLESIVHQVQQRRKGAAVQFAFEIRTVKNSDSRTGYTYETSAIMQPDLLDQLAMVRSVVAQKPIPGKPHLETSNTAATQVAATKEPVKEPAKKSA
jgi:hypothetical protein